MKYVYCNHYRNMKHQEFALDNRYHYNWETKTISFVEQDKMNFSEMYGDNVACLFCIVGENGVGKTSFVDFLCEVFVRVIAKMDRFSMDIAEIWKEFGLEGGQEVLVLFDYDGQTYMLTNIENVNLGSTIIPYKERGMLKSFRALSKIFYFSGKIEMGELFSRNGRGKYIEGSLVEDSRKRDFSEMADLQYRIQYLRTDKENNKEFVINKSLCYQLFFLRMHTDKELKNLLWENARKESFVVNIPDYQDLFQKLIHKNEEIREWKKVRKFLSDGRIVIQHFSSGQYEKFAFLSKIY